MANDHWRIRRLQRVAASLGFAASMAHRRPRPGEVVDPAPGSSLSFKPNHQAPIARPTEDDLRRMKDAGFEGVEGRAHSGGRGREDAGGGRQDRMRIHSVLYG
jgi:hypothetical protein